MERERERERQTDRQTDRQTETDRQTDRQRERGDKIILLSGLRPITTGVNIQAVRILMDPTTDLNSVF